MPSLPAEFGLLSLHGHGVRFNVSNVLKAVLSVSVLTQTKKGPLVILTGDSPEARHMTEKLSPDQFVIKLSQSINRVLLIFRKMDRDEYSGS